MIPERDDNPESLNRDVAEFDRIDKAAEKLVEAFRDDDPLQTVMILRLAAQRIYDTRCRERQAKARAAAAAAAAAAENGAEAAS